jgi:VanZ family protein
VKRILYWLLALICIALIVYFSRQPFSQQDISPYIKKYPTIVTLVKTVPDIQFHYNGKLISSHANAVGFIQFIIRKAVHITIYGLLGLSLLFALKGKNKITWKSWLLTAIIVLAVASYDEITQLKTPQRTGCIPDVIMDFTGFLIFTIPALIRAKYIKKRKEFW